MGCVDTQERGLLRICAGHVGEQLGEKEKREEEVEVAKVLRVVGVLAVVCL